MPDHVIRDVAGDSLRVERQNEVTHGHQPRTLVRLEALADADTDNEALVVLCFTAEAARRIAGELIRQADVIDSEATDAPSA